MLKKLFFSKKTAYYNHIQPPHELSDHEICELYLNDNKLVQFKIEKNKITRCFIIGAEKSDERKISREELFCKYFSITDKNQVKKEIKFNEPSLTFSVKLSCPIAVVATCIRTKMMGDKTGLEHKMLFEI